MKHKHADLIHAWADGAEIQRFSTGVDLWLDDPSPFWHPDNEYRIKPKEKKPVVRWLWAYRHPNTPDFFKQTSHFYTDTELSEDEVNKCNPIKLEWSRTEFPK